MSVSEDKRVHEITNKQYQYACLLLQNKQTNWYAKTFKTGKTPETSVYQGKKAFSDLGIW